MPARTAPEFMGFILFFQKYPYYTAIVGTAVLGLATLQTRLPPDCSALALLAVAVHFLVLTPVYSNYTRIRQGKYFHNFLQSQGCSSISAVPRPFLGSLRHKLSLLRHSGGDLLDDVFAKKYEKHGATHALLDRSGVPKVIHTIDPVDINAILRLKADDWRPAQSRANTMYPLAQDGLLNSEGDAWVRNRKLILRHINTKRVKDARGAEPDVQLLFNAIGSADHNVWTGAVDLLHLFHRLSLDMTTTYLLRTSANAQLTGMKDKKREAAMAEYDLVLNKKRNQKMTYSEAYEIVRNYFSYRSKLGSKYWMADSPRYREACSTLNGFSDTLIKRAVEERHDTSSVLPESSGNAERPDSRYGLIDSLVKEIGEPINIRNLIMDLFIAGQNVTGTMAAWVCAQLGANPSIFDQVRAEVLEKFGTDDFPLVPLTWDNLQSCSTLRNIICETLRMYTLLANIGRNANCDTVLPRGGGPDGMDPMAVSKGCAVTCNIYLTHRRAEEWGEDAWEFKRDR